MAVVKINAIHVPAGAGEQLEARFAARKHAVDGQPGFLGFQLLRPVKGDDRYFVVTTWESDEAFAAWRDGAAKDAHAGPQGGKGEQGPNGGHGAGAAQGGSKDHGGSKDQGQQRPVATGADLLEFEVVDLD